MTISLMAAQRSLLRITSGAVSRSLRLMTAKSWPRGAPSSAAPLLAAVTPGITRIDGGFSIPAESWKTSPAIPYIPASPLHTRAILRPRAAWESAHRHRSVSCRMGVA